ncbi:major facilitator superfamily domain-containing protein 6-like [Penaeus japonicus]|uniref:major facilitator superfamily domain-containing protein 6-like n=1 Tax=Penaeus japonicus TaxID=27405 RepID=UPI001C70F12A|nr:major facilitator superfamily domain-containing protein 6-like [Penaeus japonicus]
MTQSRAADSSANRSWKKWAKDELRLNKDLLPIKLILFLYSGGTSSILPYLNLHMQQLGITLREIAVISAFLPLANIFGPPIAGLFADKTGNYRLAVFLSLVLCLVFHIALLFVPARPDTTVTLACGPDGHTLDSLTCDRCDRQNDTELLLVLENCQFKCESPPWEFSLCLRNARGPVCRSFNISDQITINGSVPSIQDGETCSYTEIVHEGELFQEMVCPSECPVECQATVSYECDEDTSDGSATFWIYFGLRMIATFFMASLFTMMDALVLAVSKKYGGDYGKQRFFFIVGLATIPLLAGAIVDWRKASTGYADYSSAFYLGSALTLVSGLLVMRLQFQVEESQENILKNVMKLVTKMEINVHFVMVLLLGSNWGFIESFLFLYLETLGAPTYLMGLTLTVGSLVGLPIMFVADTVIQKMGRATVFALSFFSYTVRLIGYSYIRDPWLVFIFEAFEIITYQLMWVAAMTSCPVLAPKGLLATMTALTGTIHFSLGRGLGSLIGGYLIAAMSFPAAFRTFSAATFVCGILYVLVHYFYLRKKIPQGENVQERGEPHEEINLMQVRQDTITPHAHANNPKDSRI